MIRAGLCGQRQPRQHVGVFAIALGEAHADVGLIFLAAEVLAAQRAGDLAVERRAQ
jgi:hypothetical protein